MKYIKLYESFEDIDSICKRYSIVNYTINSDGTVDVDCPVSFYGGRLSKLPLKFGNVTGTFNCGYNSLTTLKGCPQLVDGNLICSENYLTSLEGSEQSVCHDFYCSYNQLTTLKGCPKSIGGDFYFGSNRLRDLYGFPEFFKGGISYHGNPVSEILNLFIGNSRLGKVIDFLNEYDVIQQNGKAVILDRLEEVFHTLNIEVPEIKLKNYEVY